MTVAQPKSIGVLPWPERPVAFDSSMTDVEQRADPDEGAARETELVARAKAGDDHAYAQLLERHERLSFRLAYRVTADAEEAADAVQEAFIRAHRALDRFRDGSPFRPWLLKIVYNEARGRRRSRRRISALLERVRSVPQRHQPDPMFDVLSRETRDELALAMAALRRDDRDLIYMRYFLELSEAEMAAVLGVPRGTVKSRLSRTRGRLRARLLAGEAEGRSIR
jgi:RNA polymerase sigma factor (sigma-70 family)